MLDEDILKSLHLIGWGDEEQLKEKLSSNESNFEKVFYALLLQRKTDFFENYDINKLSEWDIEGGPRRRTESYNSLLAGDRTGSTKDLYRSIDTLVVPNSTPSNSGMNSPSPLGSTSSVITTSYTNGMTNGSSSGHKSEGSSSSTSSVKTLENQASREELIKRPSVASHAKNESKSSTATVSTTTTSSSFSPGHVNNGSSSVYNNITIKTDDKGSSAHPSMNLTSPNRPVSLQINIPRNSIIEEIKGSDGGGGGGGGNNRFSLQVGTPKFHRRKDFPIPPSPVITSTPKKSWFANLFNFKPEAVTLLSESNTEETTSMIQDLMESLGIKYQEKREGGGFKCKWDGGPVPSAIVSAAKGQMIRGGSGVDNILGEGGGGGGEGGEGESLPSPDSSSSNKPTASGTQAEVQDNINSSMSTNTIWMKSVKFKIDILPASGGGANITSSSNTIGETNSTTGSTKVIFTQQQGSYSSFQVVVYNIKSTWESCEKESKTISPVPTPA
ncbi:hypothetical protein H8356DRAFT_1287157 [Neocallimastix lanati (nom. inval.)]|uniref:non-specific serine/threonine protein kinase n=1 Tax=Neocallimastix californiae TaxID=1754190 RepID=A0A1Y1XWM1_9FUNG|nr:hypothetical protein H8356DRAFT_1287157 [Neocallimastix sp. JGI-2020a]ORX90128.1 hypothetical protein LY90DRAFT_521018 [Neocallimastix californiae]|eukprot:ORX90128.1 hypothetical protein LY90DRAFT_521018 [Neocallimastix californiae]